MKLTIKRVKKGAKISNEVSPGAFMTATAPAAGYVLTIRDRSVYVPTKDLQWVVEKMKPSQTMDIDALADLREISGDAKTEKATA
jgi:hypothetical protein